MGGVLSKMVRGGMLAPQTDGSWENSPQNRWEMGGRDPCHTPLNLTVFCTTLYCDNSLKFRVQHVHEYHSTVPILTASRNKCVVKQTPCPDYHGKCTAVLPCSSVRSLHALALYAGNPLVCGMRIKSVTEEESNHTIKCQ